MLFTGTTCNDLTAAFDLGGGVLSLPADQGRALVGVEGAKPPEGSRDPTVYMSQKMPKIHSRGPFTLNYNFVNFVD